MKTIKRKATAVFVITAMILSLFVALPGKINADSGPIFTGAWTADANWGDVIYLNQIGATVYGTYYYVDSEGNHTLKGTCEGTVEGTVLTGTWCQNSAGTPNGGFTMQYSGTNSLAITWGSGSAISGINNTAEPSEHPYDESKIRYVPGNDSSKPNTPPEDVTNIDDEMTVEVATTEPTPQTEPQPVNNGEPQEITITSGEAADTTTAYNGITGITVSFKDSGAIGYRLFRSEDPNERGISVSDFYITARNFADVNVEPNTTYYYTLVEVLAEARPLEDINEQLGRTLAKWTVTTSPNVNDGFTPGAVRHFIILTLNNPMMTVDGQEQEVDPGRGTTPINYRNRTMVPIRAVVEAMGGSAGWNGANREIGLDANGNKVSMWVDKKELTVNGQKTKMDVSPIIQNDRTFTPIRFATENLNAKVDWLNTTGEIVIAWSEE